MQGGLRLRNAAKRSRYHPSLERRQGLLGSMTTLGLISIPWTPEPRLLDAALGAVLGNQGPVEM